MYEYDPKKVFIYASNFIIGIKKLSDETHRWPGLIISCFSTEVLIYFHLRSYNFVISFPFKMSTETKPSKAEYIIEQLNVNNAKKIALLTVMCFIMYHGYIHTRYGSIKS